MLYFWLVPLLAWLFVVGAAVGSFLNVCIARLGRGKSLVWPGSRCGACFREVRLQHNIPLVSYLWLRGRCRDCGTTFSVRYFLVELFTACAFVGVYLAEVGFNVNRIAGWDRDGFTALEWLRFPPFSWLLFAWHAVLVSSLIAAVGGILEFGRVARGVTVFGTAIGLVGATCLPWPFPGSPRDVLVPADSPVIPIAAGPAGSAPRHGAMPRDASWASWPLTPRSGFVPWPVWGPLPAGWSAGGELLGLLTGLVGALAGTGLVRLAGFLVRLGGRGDGVGPGSADVALMAGSFLGWQPVVVALALAAALRLVIGGGLHRLGGPRLAFGFWLGLGVVAAWLGWGVLGPLVRPLLFHPVLLPLSALAALALVYVVSLLRGLARAPEEAPFGCRA